jgi:DNA replicative helicase MCM subunit Mcm2 (Cdc46/Mcm family)
MHSQRGEKRDKSGFPVFATIIEANCIQKKGGTTNNDLTDEDKRKIKELGNDPQVLYCNREE